MISGMAAEELIIELYTNAFRKVGCGAWWNPHWIQLKWTHLEMSGKESFENLQITQKEVLPAVLACAM